MSWLYDPDRPETAWGAEPTREATLYDHFCALADAWGCCPAPRGGVKTTPEHAARLVALLSDPDARGTAIALAFDEASRAGVGMSAAQAVRACTVALDAEGVAQVRDEARRRAKAEIVARLGAVDVTEWTGYATDRAGGSADFLAYLLDGIAR